MSIYSFIYFSSTYESIHENSDAVWKTQHYHLVRDYYSRPCLPPPLILFSLLYMLIKTLIGYVKNNDNKQAASSKFTFRHCNNILLGQYHYCYHVMIHYYFFIFFLEFLKRFSEKSWTNGSNCYCMYIDMFNIECLNTILHYITIAIYSFVFKFRNKCFRIVIK